MDKTVYFFGAGATKDICPGAPLGDCLVRNALDSFKGSPEAKMVEAFITKIREDFPKDNQIWNFLDYIIQQGKTRNTRHNLEEVARIRDCLLSLIIKELKRALSDVDMETYRKFVLGIKDLRPTIISTNYDIIIDNALANIHSFNYGAKIRHSVYLPEETTPLWENGDEEYYAGGRKRPSLTGETSLNNGFVKLLKIHGSLNWLYCHKCDEIDLTVEKEGSEKLLSSIGITCINRDCTNKYEPLLITPTMSKNYENRFIKETWNNAEKALISADNLIFIGYALKDEDYQIRCLLMEALLNKSEPYKKVLVIEENLEKLEAEGKKENIKKLEDKKNKYVDLYGNKTVEFKPIGFTKYVSCLEQDKKGMPKRDG